MSGWTPERVERLKALWTECHSCSQIARLLGGVTRNAVIGKVHRLGLSGRTTTWRAKPKARKRRTQSPPARSDATPSRQSTERATPEPVTVHPEFIGPPFRMTVASLPRFGACRFPFGDPQDADFRFCGGACEASESYCEFHARIAYAPKPTRNKSRMRTGPIPQPARKKETAYG